MIIDFVQRYTERRESRRPAGEPIRTAAYDVGPIAAAAEARAFVHRHHYAATSSSTAHRFGLYLRGELAGVALFGPPASMNAHRAVWPTLAIAEAVTLGRFVLLDEVPGNGESWFIARCFELLRARGVLAVESCADPQPRTRADGTRVHRGHLGTIYQSTNGRFVAPTLRLIHDVLIDAIHTGIDFSDRGALLLIAEQMVAAAIGMPPCDDPPLTDREVTP